MKFLLVAYACLNGEIHSFILDGDMSYSDCMTAISEGVTVADIVPGVTIDLTSAPLVCELETAPSVTMAANVERTK